MRMCASRGPLSEPPWLNGLPSPYYRATHQQFQVACRAFIEQHLIPHGLEWETAGLVPDHVFPTFAKANMLIPNLSAPLPIKWLARVGINDVLGIPTNEWDYFHTGIYMDEMARVGISGPGYSLTVGMAFAIPLILHFGSNSLQQRFLPDALLGKTRWCLAITEPEAGSDVANVTTTATLSPDSKYYIINGRKKWITNAFWSDYGTMLVRTGGPGARGLSMIVCPLKGIEGISMRRLEVQGEMSAGPTFIEMDDVKVPAENLIGIEGQGMKYAMTNFNHERLTIAVGVTRQARVALSSAFRYTMKRKAFGKVLVDQPVVRHRLAQASAALETLQAYVDSLLFQMSKMNKEDADTRLGGLTALCKARAGQVLGDCAFTAVLLFGGNGYTRTGQGAQVEMIYRDVMGVRVPGGSEDVMLDLAIRQLLKYYKLAMKGTDDPAAHAKL